MNDIDEMKSICDECCDPLMLQSLLENYGENSYSDFCHLIHSRNDTFTSRSNPARENFMLWLSVCDKDCEYIEKLKGCNNYQIEYNNGILNNDNKWISRCLKNVYNFPDKEAADYYTFYTDMESAHTAGRLGTLGHMPSSTVLCKVSVPRDIEVVESKKNLQTRHPNLPTNPTFLSLLGLLNRDPHDKTKFKLTKEATWTADYSKGREYFGHSINALANEAGIDPCTVTQKLYNRKIVPSTQLLVHKTALHTNVQPVAIFTYHGPTIWQKIAQLDAD